MDKFLEIVYQLHYEKDCKVDVIGEIMEPLRILMAEKIEDQETINALEEEMLNCMCKAKRYFGVDGMKLATDIMNDKYIPTI